ncbi:MAG: condensation domain-containing protein, partial [Psychrosphaera sp.]|nr:condensation domain-containing protein [Psychrosphaera sp.]
MNIDDILARLASGGIRMYLKDGQLRSDSRPGALTPELIGLVKNNKQKLVDHLNAKTVVGSSAIDTIPVAVEARKSGVLPLSFAQQRLWFIDRMEGGGAQYNMPVAMRISGDFDETLAELAFGRIVARHEPLRTVFVDPGDGAVQSILEDVEFSLRRIDLAHFDGDEQQELVEQTVYQEAIKLFDLSADLMLRACFIRLGQDEGVLMFNVHHIASDGWSMTVLLGEFVHLYQTLRDDRPSGLAALTVQYADYALWQ